MSSGEQRSSSESPLKDTLYRFLWVTMFASEIGVYMQPVGASWLITSLVPSPFVVALLQVVASLSIFLLALPAGALSDIVDRQALPYHAILFTCCSCNLEHPYPWRFYNFFDSSRVFLLAWLGLCYEPTCKYCSSN